MNEENQSAEGFFYQPETIRWILRIFYGICVLLVLADFVVHRHIITAVEKVPAFYGLYGFIACVVLVLISSQMRKLVMRDEHYYAAPDDAVSDDAGETNSADGKKDQQAEHH